MYVSQLARSPWYSTNKHGNRSDPASYMKSSQMDLWGLSFSRVWSKLSEVNGKAHIDINRLWNRLGVLTAREMFWNHLKINSRSDRTLWQEIPLLHSPPCQEIISELSASVSHFSVYVSGSSLTKWLSFCMYDNWLVIKSNRVIKVTHFAFIIWNILAHSQVLSSSNNIHHTTEKAKRQFLLIWGLCTLGFPYRALVRDF